MVLNRLFGRELVPVPVTLFTRRGCPLCDAMQRDLAALGLDGQYTLRKVDVDADEELRDRYGWRVPVLEVEGVLLSEGRLEPASFRPRFAKIAASYRKAPPEDS